MTSVPGIFAAGDGCRAAIDAERWLEEQGEAEHAEDPDVWIATAQDTLVDRS